VKRSSYPDLGLVVGDGIPSQSEKNRSEIVGPLVSVATVAMPVPEAATDFA